MRIFVRVSALFWKYWHRALVVYFFLLAGSALALLIPRLTGRAIDLALGSAETRALVMAALGVAGAGVVRGLLSYAQSYLSEYLSQRVAYDLRNQLYNRLQGLSYAFHDHSQTGQLMSRATADVEGVRGFVGFAMIRGVYLAIMMVAIVILLFALDWKLALFSLSVIPFISYRTIRINGRLRGLWASIQQGLGVLGTIIQENLVGTRVVRAFAREKYESQKFRRQAETIYNQEIAANNLLASNSPVMSFSLMLAMAGILWYGGRQVVAGVFTQGELVQFLLYLVMLSAPVSMLGWLSTLFSRAMASGNRVFEIIDQVSPVKEKPGAIEISGVEGRVEFDDVSFSYDSHANVLKDVSFTAEPGQVIALVGASGSGKSTVANLIPRFYDVTSGHIAIDGVDVRDISISSLRRHIGIVHQDTFLFSATIRENISYGRPEATIEEITQAAKVARLHDFIASLPEGYETRVGERGITLSGGQKQRLAIARTILLNPRILIMDDSTSSVDTETEYLIQQAFAELPVGRTTFIIAHRLRSVQMADLILVLKDGQIVERGKHAELLASQGAYRQVYDLQFQDQEDGVAPIPAPVSASSAIPLEDENQHIQEPVNTNAGKEALTSSDEIIYGKPYDSRVVSRMVKYFAPYKVALPLTIVATLLYTFTLVVSPYLVGVAENKYIVTGNLGGLNMIVLLFVGNAVLNGAAYYGQIRAEARLGQSILLNLRSQIFDHIQHLSVRFFDHNEVGRVMSRAQNDIGELGDFLDSGAFWIFGEVISLIAIVFALFAMNYRLALIAVAVIPILFLYLVFWQSRARRSFIRVRQAISRVNAALQENISGVRVIQSLSREELNSRNFEEVNHQHFDANVRASRVSASMMPVVESLVALVTGGVILYGGMGVLNSTLLVGTVVAFLLYIQRFFDPIRALTMEYGQLQRAMASGTRIFELLDVPAETDDVQVLAVPRLRGEIDFEDVCFSYEPETEVLHGISLHMSPGETVALVGPTGAGKTTIVSLIARFYDATSGRILVDGHDLRNLDREAYRRQIGLVLQDPFLFSGTVKDNIRYGNLGATDGEIISASKTVGAHDFIMHLENGYDTEVQERGQNLSMGQRQLISFARALLADPVILMLDEATANVDSYSERVLQQGIRSLIKGRTTVVIAHRLSTVREADRIVVLDKGRIVEEGRHAELLSHGGLYARLYEMNYAPIVAGGE
jgi:ATP-binding cassette subfamily B protein